jgi:hypothetical protein
VCVFAGQDDRRLAASLSALGSASGDLQCEYTIMADPGSALSTAVSGPAFRVFSLPIADRANAWNDYAHRLAPAADAHIFLDASVSPCGGAFVELVSALRSSPNALAATALAAAGRTRRRWARRTIVECGLNGQLYALSDDCLKEFRARGIFLPIGLIGDEGFIAYVLRTRFTGGPDDSARDSIVAATNAHFEFTSIPCSLQGVKAYHAQLLRFAQRRLQNELLYPLLKEKGIEAAPQSVAMLRAMGRLPQPRSGLIEGLFDRLVMRELRRVRHLGGVTPSNTTRPAA